MTVACGLIMLAPVVGGPTPQMQKYSEKAPFVHGPALPLQECKAQNLLRNQGLGLEPFPNMIPLHLASTFSPRVVTTPFPQFLEISSCPTRSRILTPDNPSITYEERHSDNGL